MKTVAVEAATLDMCVAEAQREGVILTRDGQPIALVVPIDGMDEEQIRLCSSQEFWKLMEERRRDNTISRAELERRLCRVPRRTEYWYV
jgi:antitoxin (DNA-binding transcriptional repressor) of toxin-antitoxin stability system